MTNIRYVEIMKKMMMFERIRTVDDGDETIDLFAIDGTRVISKCRNLSA